MAGNTSKNLNIPIIYYRVIENTREARKKVKKKVQVSSYKSQVSRTQTEETEKRRARTISSDARSPEMVLLSSLVMSPAHAQSSERSEWSEWSVNRGIPVIPCLRPILLISFPADPCRSVRDGLFRRSPHVLRPCRCPADWPRGSSGRGTSGADRPCRRCRTRWP